MEGDIMVTVPIWLWIRMTRCCRFTLDLQNHHLMGFREVGKMCCIFWVTRWIWWCVTFRLVCDQKEVFLVTARNTAKIPVLFCQLKCVLNTYTHTPLLTKISTFFSYSCVKINKGKSCLKWRREVRSGLCLSPHHSSIEDSKRKRGTLQVHTILSTLPPKWEKKGFLLLSNSPANECQNSANEKPLYFKLPVYSNGLSAFHNSLPNSALCSVKDCFSPSSQDLSTVFP